MANTVPAINASGIYTLLTPFETRPNTVYSCKAIRTFEDLYRLQQDVFKLYYEPYGLSQANFDADRISNSVSIVTLVAVEVGLEINPSDPKTIIYVPSSYISSFPDSNNIPYSHIVLSASLGVIPDYLDVSDTMADIGNIISEKIGITPEVNIHKALSSGVVTESMHVTAETARQAAITNRNTIYSQFTELNNSYNSMLARYNTLEASFITMNANNSDNVDYLDSIGYFTIDLLNNSSDDTVYFDSNFFNKIKYGMDLSAHPAGSYIEITAPLTIDGVTASLVSGDLLFTVNKLNVTLPSTIFNIKVFDSSNVEIDSFNITIVFTPLTTNSIFGNQTLNFDLTNAAPHTQRIYFGDFRRTDRILYVDTPTLDPINANELYYELSKTVSGITIVYGKNFIEFNVDESSYTGNVDTTIDLFFLKRTGFTTPTDLPATISLHITNTI